MVHVITLPPDYSGKELVFEMYLSEDNGYGNFEAPIFGSHPDVTGVYVQDNIVTIQLIGVYHSISCLSL